MSLERDEPDLRVKNLADSVLEHLHAGEKASDSKDIDDQIVEVYTKVGIMLSRYKSGKIPKAFKIIPRLSNWEFIVGLTKPDDWTPNATYQASRVFLSSLTPKMAEKFLSFILLPKVRQDIADNKKLNSHLYESLKKALFKPAAFFKGIVLPLCESDGQNSSSAAGLTNEDTTLREATIISSVLGKMSVPVLHSAAALLKLSQLSYSGPRSIFIKTLLDKRYALPERVVEAMVSYFLRFRGDSAEYPEQLPVLWHQSLLIFTQRYKHQLSHEQLDALTNLATKEHSHHQITPEIVRELEQGRIMQA